MSDQRKRLESEIQAAILAYLKSLAGCWAVKVTTCNRSGCPDILGAYRGRFFGLEVKAERGSTSAIQDYQIEKIQYAGGAVAVVNSVDAAAAFMAAMEFPVNERGPGVLSPGP